MKQNKQKNSSFFIFLGTKKSKNIDLTSFLPDQNQSFPFLYSVGALNCDAFLEVDKEKK